jgi:CRP-like cAMP-binding protein
MILLPDNRLLDTLEEAARIRVLAACDLVTLSTREILCEVGSEMTHAWFPMTASISIVVAAAGHPALGVVVIGREGMLGATLVLGVETAPSTAMALNKGTAMRISSSDFMLLLAESPEIMRIVNRYNFVLMNFLSQSSACHRFHEVEPRLVRWLLLTHDRAQGDSFNLTHLLLAEMLGVQRSAVTIAAGILQQKNLISYARGVITIVDRIGLEKLSCECYGLLVADYQRQIA